MANDFCVSLINNNSVVSSISCDKCIKIVDFISNFPNSEQIVAVKINNIINSLDSYLDYNATVEPIYLNILIS